VIDGHTTPTIPMASVSAASTRARATAPASSLLRRRPPLQLPQPAQSHHVSLLCLHRPGSSDLRCRRRLMTARGESPRDEDEEDEETAAGFDAAVALFNGGDFHACHDVVEELWYSADDPARTLLHGVLQCAVGFHHLFNQVPTHLLQTFVLLLKES
jgi:hypothetical protein